MCFIIMFIIYFSLFDYKLQKGKNSVVLMPLCEMRSRAWQGDYSVSIDHCWRSGE